MKKTILFLALIISFSNFSQSMWKKEADRYKQNGIKEVKIYLLDLEHQNEKRLWDWELYDKNGRMIEKKRFQPNGALESHYKFEYPNDTSRILISYNSKGKEIKRVDQEFDLSGDKSPQNQYSKNGAFEYEYNKAGDVTKVWRVKDNPKRLQTENVYDEKGFLIESKSLVFTNNQKSNYISTSTYCVDNTGNISKITTEANGTITSVAIYEYVKHNN